jgi:hypothetical protein
MFSLRRFAARRSASFVTLPALVELHARGNRSAPKRTIDMHLGHRAPVQRVDEDEDGVTIWMRAPRLHDPEHVAFDDTCRYLLQDVQ